MVRALCFIPAANTIDERLLSCMYRKIADSHIRRSQFHSKTIKVPQMAESISEGTLRSWSKQVGDTVEADEEVATIETDKACINFLALLKTLILPHVD